MGSFVGRRVAVGMAVVATAASLLGASGCGGPKRPKIYPTTGTVTLDGKPLADATVSFVPTSGPPSDGRTDASGKYVIMTAGEPGAPFGACKVTVSKHTSPGSMPTMAPSPDDMKKMYEAKKKGEKNKEEVPAKYGRTDTSGFKADVTSDPAKNVFDFELTTK